VTDKVVDASAFAAVVFAEPKMAQVETLIFGHRLFAPYFFKSELANVCVKKIRQFPEQRDTILGLFSAAWHTPFNFADIDPVAVLALAERLRLSACDASYLWLAKHLDAELVTLDQDLEKASKKP
jgi:predicted nucleic acid-binding protein